MLDKIYLKNYKNFPDETIEFNNKRNIFIGENGVGKSSLIEAISLVLSGSYSKIEKKGIESLFNVCAISNFMNGDRCLNNLPELIIELYFNSYTKQFNNGYELDGRVNSAKSDNIGLQLKISPDLERYGDEINVSLNHERSSSFPFDYYKVEFYTFANKAYSSFNRVHQFKHTLIDTTSINRISTIKNYISQVFKNQAKDETKNISHAYRKLTKQFSEELYEKYNLSTNSDGYKLKVKSVSEKNFDNVLTLHKNNIELESFGLGERVILSVSSLLEAAVEDILIILIEEPENHLSYLNTQKLIDMIEQQSGSKQTFITTHDNMIASRLNLQNLILISRLGKHTTLSQLSKETAEFFIKRPNNNILNFILAKKAILVEGDAEYILMEKFYENIRDKLPHQDNITIIACGGKTFKRYLEVAKMLNNKVAVITDNDKDYNNNIMETYKDYTSENIQVFSDNSSDNYTFEVCLYNCNQKFYDDYFATNKMKNGTLPFLLNNKTEAAFRVASNYPTQFKIPLYIQEAIDWLNRKK